MSGATNGNIRQHARIHKDELPIILNKELSGCAWAVYVTLRTRSNPGSDFWTDAPTLNEMIGPFYHKTTVSRAIGELSAKGLVERTGRTNRARYHVLPLDVASGENANSRDQTTDDKAKTISENANSCGQTISENAQTISVFASPPPGTASQTAASRPPNRQNKQKDKTNKERGACAPVAACAAPPPPIFSHDQNPETKDRQQPQATAATQNETVRKRGEGTKAKTKRGTRMTLEELPTAWLEWTEGFIDHYATGDLINIDRTWLKFRDHFKSATGRNATKLDWLATWKNWLRHDLDSLEQRQTTRKIIEENRSARARREAEQRRREERREAEQRKEREAAERRERDELRRIELAPTIARVKAHIITADHGLAAIDVANSLDMTEDDLEEVYRLGLARDSDIICCSPKLRPTGEWISAAARAAREAAEKAKPQAQPAPAPATTSSWYDDEPEAPAPAAAPPAPVPSPATPAPAPAPATRCTSAELENAYSAVVDAGSRGIDIADVPNLTHRVLRELRDAGRVRLDGATITATKFSSRSDEPKPLSEALMGHFSTASSNTSASGWIGITGRQVI